MMPSPPRGASKCCHRRKRTIIGQVVGARRKRLVRRDLATLITLRQFARNTPDASARRSRRRRITGPHLESQPRQGQARTHHRRNPTRFRLGAAVRRRGNRPAGKRNCTDGRRRDTTGGSRTHLPRQPHKLHARRTPPCNEPTRQRRCLGHGEERWRYRRRCQREVSNDCENAVSGAGRSRRPFSARIHHRVARVVSRLFNPITICPPRISEMWRDVLSGCLANAQKLINKKGPPASQRQAGPSNSRGAAVQKSDLPRACASCSTSPSQV